MSECTEKQKMQNLKIISKAQTNCLRILTPYPFSLESGVKV